MPDYPIALLRSPASGIATINGIIRDNNDGTFATVVALNRPTGVARLVSAAASTNATVVKGSAGQVFRVIGHNTAAAIRYLKLYNKATAPTVGTDTPVVTLALPATASFQIDLEAFAFPLGIGYALTVNAADADTTALTAGDVVGLNILFL